MRKLFSTFNSLLRDQQKLDVFEKLFYYNFQFSLARSVRGPASSEIIEDTFNSLLRDQIDQAWENLYEWYTFNSLLRDQPDESHTRAARARKLSILSCEIS